MGAKRRRATAPGNSFVIQEHHATALHWDFRLEHEGVLVSWAIPKGVPIDPKRNHLAVHTEDHPLDYGQFSGTIPAGEYGGGAVTIWDHGHYDLEKWNEREVMVVLHGERAEGRYVLFQTGGKNWMIHRMDPPPDGYAPMPEIPAPMLASSGELPGDDEGWAYEFKWDGVRAIVAVDGGRTRAYSRNGREITSTFPELAAVGSFLGASPALLDGEIVALSTTRAVRTSVIRLQHRPPAHPDAARSPAGRRSPRRPCSSSICSTSTARGSSTRRTTSVADASKSPSRGLAGDGASRPRPLHRHARCAGAPRGRRASARRCRREAP